MVKNYLLLNPHLKLLYISWNLYRKFLNVLLQILMYVGLSKFAMCGSPGESSERRVGE